MKYEPNIRMIELPCTGKTNALFILKAFERSADGVLVSGCHPGDCHYAAVDYNARRRSAIFKKILSSSEVDPRRLQVAWVSASEGAKWVDVVNDAAGQVRDIGLINSNQPAETGSDEEEGSHG